MSKEKTIKITVRIYHSDYERLKEFYSALGLNRGLRAMIRHHVEQLQRTAASHLQQDHGLDSPVQGLPKPDVSW